MKPYDHWVDLLTDMTLPPSSSVAGQISSTDEANHRLNLSTIHSVKRLGWDKVFVLWALDGRFPSYRAIHRPHALGEERRLMYVAATRAREYLFITYPTQIYDRAGQTVLYRPSRFLESVPDELLDKTFNPQERQLRSALCRHPPSRVFSKAE